MDEDKYTCNICMNLYDLKIKTVQHEYTIPTNSFVYFDEKNIGYFLISSLIDELKVKEDIDILASVKNFQFSLFEMINQLIYARIIDPCSKSKTASSVFPHLYKYSDISEDQIYDGLEFIGENYKKYIELFNHQYEKYYERDYEAVLGAYKEVDDIPIRDVAPRNDLPENFDLRKKYPNCKALQEIRDQSECGSCWAFAAAEVMSDRLCIHSDGKVQTKVSTQNIVSCCEFCG